MSSSSHAAKSARSAKDNFTKQTARKGGFVLYYPHGKSGGFAEPRRLYVSYPEDLRKGVEDAVVAWKAFCALPRDQKLKFPYDPDSKTSGNGYELKEGSSFDLKENVHLRTSVRDVLMEHARKVDPFIAPAFVEKALALNELMVPTLRAFSEAVEEEIMTYRDSLVMCLRYSQTGLSVSFIISATERRAKKLRRRITIRADLHCICMKVIQVSNVLISKPANGRVCRSRMTRP